MIKYALLKDRFDALLMQQEVHELEKDFWKPHYNISQYEGGWTTLSLRAINGNTDNGVSIQSSSLQKNMAYQDTPLLNQCTYISKVVDFFECEKMSVRLMKLQAGAIIKTHTDYDMSFEEGEARFHIPVISNPDVSFFIEEEKIPMLQGECWYLNLSLKHRVQNFGAIDRIHLVIDCVVNDWVKMMLGESTSLKKEAAETSKKTYTTTDKINIIQQLRGMNTPVSNELADKMEADEN